MHDDVDLNDLFTLSTDTTPAPMARRAAKDAVEAAKAAASTEALVTTAVPSRRKRRFGLHKRAMFIAVGVLVVGGGAAALAASGVFHHSTTSAAAPFPVKAAALDCVRIFNGPAGAKVRTLITNRELRVPSSYRLAPSSNQRMMYAVQREIAAAGKPITATFTFFGAAGHCRSTGPTVTFSKNGVRQTFRFDELARPYLNGAGWDGVGTRNLLPTANGSTTKVLADGMLSTDVQPPATTGSWGGRFTEETRVITTRVPITSTETCIPMRITENRAGSVYSTGSLINSPLTADGKSLQAIGKPGGMGPVQITKIAPNAPVLARTCFYWDGHITDPLAYLPHLHLGNQRTVDMIYWDATKLSSIMVSYRFKIVPAAPTSPHPKRWLLVYEGARRTPT